jgi:hypothetical protein
MTAADDLLVARHALIRQIIAVVEIPSGPYAERLTSAIETFISAKVAHMLPINRINQRLLDDKS